MLLEEFDYHLPYELIAQEPLKRRDASRLLVLNRDTQEIQHHQFQELPDLLPPGCLIVLNESKVIPARIFCRKAGSSGKVEVLLTRRISDRLWEGLIKPSKRVRPGCRLIVEENEMEIQVLSRNPNGTRCLELLYTRDFWELLEKYGHTPLPPYIRKKLDDRSRYQTIYGRIEGSVAAPTAGLHFTTETFAELRNKGINTAFITLHIGPGTFRPVKTSLIENHTMETEYFSIDGENAKKIRNTLLNEQKVIAVGTTVVRTIESAYLLNGLTAPCEGLTDLFIYPGFEFNVSKALITNFHLPRSTLLMLVSAFAGKDFILKAYNEAIKSHYRFYSFGDAMLIL